MRVGIDGSNLRQGGGITHLVQLLGAADPSACGIDRVVVWGGRQLLDRLPDRPWLARFHEAALDGSSLSRLHWQQFRLSALARGAADLLFVPGGMYLGNFRPFVTMFRNMLPFDDVERRSYGFSGMRAKLEVLRRAQATTFRRADGVIFLTEYGRESLLETVKVQGLQAVIPHGLDPRFFAPAPRQGDLSEFTWERPFRWLYVSAILEYKHPWNVVEAAAMVRAEGVPVALELVGPPYPAAMSRLQAVIARVDLHRAFITVKANRAHEDLPAVFRDATGFVFASTCENLPNSLLEAMAAGLPIVCSDRPPMPHILAGGGVYCDPTSPSSIAAAMRDLVRDPILRRRIVHKAQGLARAYDWTRCARDTFAFLARVRRRDGSLRCLASQPRTTNDAGAVEAS